MESNRTPSLELTACEYAWMTFGVIILTLTVEMRRFRIQNLVVLQCHMRIPADDYYGCCRHNLQAPSSLEQSVHVGRVQDMDRWRACNIGTGIPNIVRRLDSTCWMVNSNGGSFVTIVKQVNVDKVDEIETRATWSDIGIAGSTETETETCKIVWD